MATLVALELGTRAFLGRFAGEAERVAYLYPRERIEAMGEYGFALPLPGVQYGLAPGRQGHNRLGFRGPEVEWERPEGAFRIVAIGGSTTYGYGLPEAEAYPRRLEEVLHRDYGLTEVEVVNAGVPGYTSWQSFSHLAFRVLELRPQLIIIYEGGNDIAPRLEDPDCYAGANPLRGLDPRGLVWRMGDGRPLPRSALLRMASIRLGRISNPAELESQLVRVPVECGSGRPWSGDNLAHNPPTHFARNLRHMVTLAAANGAESLLLSWTYAPHLVQSFDFAPAAVDEMNHTVQAVAEETGARFFDLHGVFPADRAYWLDAVHMNARGSSLHAELVARHLIESGLLSSPGRPLPAT